MLGFQLIICKACLMMIEVNVQDPKVLINSSAIISQIIMITYILKRNMIVQECTIIYHDSFPYVYTTACKGVSRHASYRGHCFPNLFQRNCHWLSFFKLNNISSVVRTIAQSSLYHFMRVWQHNLKQTWWWEDVSKIM